MGRIKSDYNHKDIVGNAIFVVFIGKDESQIDGIKNPAYTSNIYI